MIPAPEKEWTLAQIRVALASLDRERFVKRSSYEDVAILENSIHELRNAERALIAQNEEELISRLKSAAQSLSTHSRTIRMNVAKMNRTVKVMDQIEGVIKRVSDVMREFNKWH